MGQPYPGRSFPIFGAHTPQAVVPSALGRRAWRPRRRTTRLEEAGRCPPSPTSTEKSRHNSLGEQTECPVPESAPSSSTARRPPMSRYESRRSAGCVRVPASARTRCGGTRTRARAPPGCREFRHSYQTLARLARLLPPSSHQSGRGRRSG